MRDLGRAPLLVGFAPARCHGRGRMARFHRARLWKAFQSDQYFWNAVRYHCSISEFSSVHNVDNHQSSISVLYCGPKYFSADVPVGVVAPGNVARYRRRGRKQLSLGDRLPAARPGLYGNPSFPRLGDGLHPPDADGLAGGGFAGAPGSRARSASPARRRRPAFPFRRRLPVGMDVPAGHRAGAGGRSPARRAGGAAFDRPAGLGDDRRGRGGFDRRRRSVALVEPPALSSGGAGYDIHGHAAAVALGRPFLDLLP